MTDQNMYRPGIVQQAPRPVKQRRRWPWVVGVVAAFVMGVAFGSSGKTSTTTVAQPAPVTKTVTAQAAANQPAAAAPAPAAFGDGTYKVGADIPAGSYKTIGPRPGGIGLCYWARLRDDSGNDIIANDNSQGPTRFTSKAGEYVQITGCDFTKA